MLRPVDDALVMQQLLYAAEVRPIGELEIPKTEVREAELKLARQLIDQQATDTFDPAGYTDEVKARIEAAMQKKVEGQEIALAEEAPCRRRAGDRPHGGAPREPAEARARGRAAGRSEGAQGAEARRAGAAAPAKRAAKK